MFYVLTSPNELRALFRGRGGEGGGMTWLASSPTISVATLSAPVTEAAVVATAAAAAVLDAVIDPGYMSRKNRKFRTNGFR